MLVAIGGECFILPLTAVEECAEYSREELADTTGRRIVNIRGEVMPYVRLREMFAMAGEAPSLKQMVIVRWEGSRLGLVVDDVIGGHQTVIKNLGRL